MAEETTPTPRAEPVHRLHGVSTDLDGRIWLNLFREVGRRQSLIEVELTPVEAARLIEQAAGALRSTLPVQRG